MNDHGLKLTVKKPRGADDRQWAIESNFEQLDGQWEDIYFNVGGYFGPYNPALFASAPDLLAALKEVMPYIVGDKNVPWRDAQSAIAKAEGVAE